MLHFNHAYYNIPTYTVIISASALLPLIRPGRRILLPRKITYQYAGYLIRNSVRLLRYAVLPSNQNWWLDISRYLLPHLRLMPLVVGNTPFHSLPQRIFTVAAPSLSRCQFVVESAISSPV
jgi:hypothetical protein